MPSGGYASLLRRRALGFLREAREATDPDLAAFFAEQAIQLYIKATIYELFGEQVRGHGLREMLGHLARLLEKAGYREEAEAIREFIARKRSLLIEAEEAYTLARYGEEGYSGEDAEALVGLAEELVRLLEGVSRRVKLG